jgi:hypothetical protein
MTPPVMFERKNDALHPRKSVVSRDAFETVSLQRKAHRPPEASGLTLSRPQIAGLAQPGNAKFPTAVS